MGLSSRDFFEPFSCISDIQYPRFLFYVRKFFSGRSATNHERRSGYPWKRLAGRKTKTFTHSLPIPTGWLLTSFRTSIPQLSYIFPHSRLRVRHKYWKIYQVKQVIPVVSGHNYQTLLPQQLALTQFIPCGNKLKSGHSNW